MATPVPNVDASNQLRIRTMSIDDLAAAVQSLPSELFDEIYDLTFTFDSKTCCVESRTYKPPSAIQVDRKSRSKAAKSYYNNTVFTFSTKGYDFEDDADGKSWLASLPEDHVKALREIHLDFADLKTGYPYSAALVYFPSELFGACPREFDREEYVNDQNLEIKRVKIQLDGTVSEIPLFCLEYRERLLNAKFIVDVRQLLSKPRSDGRH